jgi:hypothetical protein
MGQVTVEAHLVGSFFRTLLYRVGLYTHLGKILGTGVELGMAAAAELQNALDPRHVGVFVSVPHVTGERVVTVLAPHPRVRTFVVGLLDVVVALSAGLVASVPDLLLRILSDAVAAVMTVAAERIRLDEDLADNGCGKNGGKEDEDSEYVLTVFYCHSPFSTVEG